ncbi:MAG: HEAT repeat domain-containing protein [Planctomycetes bacterium]|nr:HEAT repeat domain-containing protein [Planctomycetota bacterium]
MGQISLVLQIIGKGDEKYISDDLLPDYISFLKDKNGKVQQVGAMGLYRARTPEATKALFEYLKTKDLRKLDKNIEEGKVDFDQAAGEVYASIAAISALGVSGDKSAIPLLKSLQGIQSLKLEMGGYPVEEALVRLGAIDSLINIPPNADKEKIERASYAIRKIRDPNKVPELIAAINNNNCDQAIRSSAIEALGKINTVGSIEFLLAAINDSNIPVNMHRTALLASAQTNNEIFEETFLTIANSDSEIRAEAWHGLAILLPDKYMKKRIDKIRDEKESDEFRMRLTSTWYYVKPKTLESCKDDLYACLNTNKKDGSPYDKIRIRMWCLIYDLFGEMPTLVLSHKCNPQNLKSQLMGLSGIKSRIQEHLRKKWLREPGNKPWNAPVNSVFKKMADDKFNSLVTFLPTESEVEK